MVNLTLLFMLNILTSWKTRFYMYHVQTNIRHFSNIDLKENGRQFEFIYDICPFNFLQV